MIDLVGHLIYGQNLLRRLADGAPWTTEPNPGQLAGDEPLGAWTEAKTATDERLDAAALSTVVSTPVGHVVLRDFLDQRVSMELLVHAWDLGRATGRRAPAEGDLARRIHARIELFDEQIRGPRRYGARQHTTSSDELDQLAAFLGRTVD